MDCLYSEARPTFSDKVGVFTEDQMASVKCAVEAIKTLATASSEISALLGPSIDSFVIQLPMLGQGLAGFASSLSENGLDDATLATVTCAAQAIKTLASVSAEIPNSGGLLAAIVGDNDLGTFAAQFPVLGAGLAAFLSNIGTFTDEQVATVNCAAEAIKTLATASSEIPNAGGWLGAIVGENDLSTFAAQFPILGTGLANFLTNVGTFTEDQVATVDCAAKAIKLLAEASSQIPNDGGWVGAIVGENNLGTFADQFPKLGAGLSGFLEKAGTLNDDQLTTISCAAEAVKVLASAASNIPNSGGWAEAIVGNNDLGTFASEFPKVGEGIAGFAEKLGTFSGDKLSTVHAGINAVKAIAQLSATNLSAATANMSGFGEKLVGFGDKVAEFCNGLANTSAASVVAAVSNVNKLVKMVRDMDGLNSDAAANFSDALNKLGDSGVDKFVEAFTSTSAKKEVKDAAKKLGDEIIAGIKSKFTDIKIQATKAAEKAVDGVETQDDDMESAGKDLGSGLVKGIKAKKQAAYDAGYALGKAAVQGEKDGQESNSPSKATMRSGNDLGEGLVIGIKQMGKRVYNAGSNMGETATKSISSAISRVTDMINSDIDSQPTIRPVLDLSDVQAGAGLIGSILDTGSSVGVVANVGAISSMMNTRGQNGGNSDVVSAINKLNKKMDSIGNTSYTINGITYDDGSNISDAIATIARAALRERRV